MAARKKPPITFDKKPSSPFSDKLRQGPKAPSASGPKMDKPANSNVKKPKSPITFKDKPKTGTPFSDAQKKASTVKKPVSTATTAPKETPKPTSQAKSPAETRRSIMRDRSTPRPARDMKPGSLRAKALSEAESLAGKGVRLGLKTAARLAGVANIGVDMIANAQPTNLGENEWLKNKGPLMPGNSPSTFGKRNPAGASPKPASKPSSSSTYSGYGTFNNPMPAAPKKGPGTSYPAPSAAAPSSTSDSKFKKGSYTELAFKPTGDTKQRGAVTTTQSAAPTPATSAAPAAPRKPLQTRFQRDSGLAMDSRKRK